MANPTQTIRIFISSPGDVAEEREGARRVVEGLQRLYPGVTLQPVLWEELALPVTASFQETIDFLLEREPIDIAVFILWSRLGSPLGASITRPDGSPYRSGTEREFDLMLTAFEQSGRKRPVILAYVRDDDTAFRENLTDCPDPELEGLIQQRRLAEAFVREQFHDAEGRNLRAYQTYREPIGFREQLKGHLRRALDDLLEVEKAATWTDDPYRGLETFDVQHAPIFYGRDEETCDLLQRLRDQRRSGCAFVVIVAASGSGKSSLARAGVAANLVQGADDDEGAQWHVVSLIPALAERSLCHELARSLAEALPDLVDSDESAERIGKGLGENASLTVEMMIAPAFDRAGKPVRLLLILDQMEELWTDKNTSEDDRERFLAAVAALAESGHVAVLATLRSDFYPHAQRSPTFLNLKGRLGHYDLLPPDAASIHRLITEPARLAGLSFSRNEKTGKSLDEVLWEDVSHDPDALPLLEYTLSELYRQRDEDRRMMTFAAYVELGGVEGAIGKRADETFAGLPAEVRAAFDEILPLLVSVDVAGEQAAVRRRASVADLTSTPARKTLTECLIEQRFLTTDREGETAVASLAHEALLGSWNRIAGWIDVNRELLRLRARVEQQQQRWRQQDRDDSLLLAEGLPLDEAKQLVQEAPYLLTASTGDYIRNSVEYQRQRATRHRLTKQLVAGLIVLCLVSLVSSLLINNARIKDKALQEDAFDRNRETVEALDNLTLSLDVLEYFPGTQVLHKKLLEQAMMGYEKLTLRESVYPELELERGRTLVKLGDLNKKQRDFVNARKCYKEALKLFEFHSDNEKLSLFFSTEHGNVHAKVGLTLSSQDKNNEALDAFAAAIMELTELVERTEDPLPRRFLAAARYNAANVLRRTAKDDLAIEYLEDGLQQYGLLGAASDGASELGIARSQELLGRIYRDRGEQVTAMTYFNEAINGLKPLVDAQPDNPEYFDALASAYNSQAATFRTRGLETQLHDSLQTAADFYRELREVRPLMPKYSARLATVLTNLGLSLHESGRNAKAEEFLNEAYNILESLDAIGWQGPRYREQFAVCQDALGQVYLDTKEDPGDVMKLAETFVTNQIQTAATNEEKIRLFQQLAIYEAHLARTFQRQNELDSAEQTFESARKRIEQLTQLVGDLPRYSNVLAHIHYRHALMLYEQGDQRASDRFQKARDLWTAIEPRAASYTYDLAWLLAVCPSESVRDAQAALGFAEEAVQLAPENANYLATQALAAVLTGQADQAVTLLDKSKAARGNWIDRDFFVLAMAQKLAGKSDEAQQSLGAAIKWMDENRPYNADMKLLRAMTESRLSTKAK